MRLGRRKKAKAANVLSMPEQPVAELTNSAAPKTSDSYMRDEVYYHHWAQMINVWPYL